MQPSCKHALAVLPIPAFADNYLWLIHDGVHAAVVDPGDAAPVLAALKARHLSLTAILLTHHHADHTGGVSELLRHCAVPVFGPANEAITCVTAPLHDGDLIDLPALELDLTVLGVPGHTRGHIAYVGRAPHAPAWLFCGDTLFAGGCGRLFEGTPQQMAASLDKLAALPDETLVYCAHEYTLSNLRFALAVEPDNPDLQARLHSDSAKRAQGSPTVPSNIGLEKATNPFLRYDQPAIVNALINADRLAPDASPLAAFTALRQWKNEF